MKSKQAARRVPLATPFGRQVRSGRSAGGTILSAVLHTAIIALLLWKTGQQFVDANEGLGNDSGRGGGGGGGARALDMFALAGAAAAEVPAAAVPPPITVPQQIPTTIADAPTPPVPEAQVAAAPAPGPGEGAGAGPGAGPGSGTGTGGGSGGGTGTGVGNDSGPGGGGTVYQPQLQGILIPPTDGKPRELRGVRIVVTFRISERGEVVGLETDPVIRDRGYRNEFMDRMRRYTFTPAMTRDGHPVASQISITITL